ncbi:hypothetical protein SARC_05860 [Sphaeroforma arctica JP610]|uniref:Uncharacterized protein n=1 Tax=Sphaeroforma arctica JP610 TaxID=667725 RepID=A0A0L0FYD1_9EUKA|nr:hypothetical protein SARC_05860 [Sphaeroforma arctica JP610]KNC81840.1 hypothetical protein SARC_05860 [Sphaeroforma arctica JP610]|eukprot:XP_014155742.1 hypothetical protein SARC_05860 [Sphaeroforma arctica JP610]
MQNAITTTFDGAVVRTTHYTGMTTDLAVLTAHAITGRVDKSEYWQFMLFVPQLLSYFGGNIVGAVVYNCEDIEARALFIPAFVSGVLGIMYVFDLSQIFHTSFYAMMTRSQEGVEDGTATWMRAKDIVTNAVDKMAKGEETRCLLKHRFASYASLAPSIRRSGL